MAHATISSKGQITLPLPVRKKLNIQKGDLCEVDTEGNEVILKFQKFPARKRSIDLSKWLGTKPGVFDSAKDADSSIRNIRDGWEK